MLQNLAKRVEGCPETALREIVEGVKSALEAHAPETEFSALKQDRDPLEELREDIRLAKQGPIPYQTVLSATTTLAEPYWHALDDAGKRVWMDEFNSKWLIWRHAIPVENAEKICLLLESGQLRVVKGSSVTWNDKTAHFELSEENMVHKAHILIEALGQEYDMAKINS